MNTRSLVLSLLALLAPVHGEWNFRSFLEGEWDLERPSVSNPAALDYAHYTLKAEADVLVGTYHEDGTDGPKNEMSVRVSFDDSSGMAGQFQLAKAQSASSDLKTVFDFAFRPQSGGRFHLSESRWLAGKGGTVQFLAMEEHFVFTKLSSNCDGDGPAVSSWTAARRGASRAVAGSSGKRSMLQRWGKWFGVALAYYAYKFLTQKAKLS